MFSSVHLEPHHPIIERGFSAFAMSLFVEYQPSEPRRQGRPLWRWSREGKTGSRCRVLHFPWGSFPLTVHSKAYQVLKDVKISGIRILAHIFSIQPKPLDNNEAGQPLPFLTGECVTDHSCVTRTSRGGERVWGQ